MSDQSKETSPFPGDNWSAPDGLREIAEQLTPYHTASVIIGRHEASGAIERAMRLAIEATSWNCLGRPLEECFNPKLDYERIFARMAELLKAEKRERG